MSYINDKIKPKSRLQSFYFPYIRTFIIFFSLISYFSNVQAAIIMGNPKGNINVRFVYDYECPYCHKTYIILHKLAAKHNNIEIKLYPVAIINQNSLFAATAAIVATQYPNAFLQYTNYAVYQPPMSQGQIQRLLSLLKLNTPQFQQSMHSQWVEQQILEGLDILKHYHINRVPLLIISIAEKPAVILVGEQDEAKLSRIINQLLREGHN